MKDTDGRGGGVWDEATKDGDGYGNTIYTRIDYSKGRENVVIAGYGETGFAVGTLSGAGSERASGHGSGIGVGHGGTPDNINDGVG
jgi:hypothetical protein